MATLALTLAARQETAFPAWGAALVLLVPLVIMAVLAGWGMRSRTRRRRARASPLSRRIEGVAIGSAATIADGGQVPWENLLDALAIAPENHGPGPDGKPWDEGYGATMLGLRSRISDATEIAEPHVFWGERSGGQVFIRIGVDEKGEGGELYSNRRLRQITVVRAALPAFELLGEDGAFSPAPGSAAVPEAAVAFFSSLAPSPEVWHRLRLVAGPEGIVATRPLVDDYLSGWIYDLWLCERLALVLGAPALPAKRIGPAWKVPYGLGRAT